MRKISILTLALSSLTAFGAESFNKGNIQLTEKAAPGSRKILTITAKKPIDPIEAKTLAFLQMGKTCKHHFLYLDRQENTPEEGPVKSATVEFHCTVTPEFFQNKPGLQLEVIRDLCRNEKSKAEYLQQLCHAAGGG